jgi:hypothetical protein
MLPFHVMNFFLSAMGILIFKTKKSIVRFLENRNFDVIGNDTGIDYLDNWIYDSADCTYNC